LIQLQKFEMQWSTAMKTNNFCSDYIISPHLGSSVKLVVYAISAYYKLNFCNHREINQVINDQLIESNKHVQISHGYDYCAWIRIAHLIPS
jgi:hypothetical protein